MSTWMFWKRLHHFMRQLNFDYDNERKYTIYGYTETNLSAWLAGLCHSMKTIMIKFKNIQ